MKSTLRLKFIMLYIIFDFSIFTVSSCRISFCSINWNRIPHKICTGLQIRLRPPTCPHTFQMIFQPGLFILSCRPCSCI